MKLVSHNHSEILYFTTAKEPFGWLDNSYEHPIHYKGVEFMSAETLFQWLRFEAHPNVQSDILRMITVRGARQKAFENLHLLQRSGDPDCHYADIDRVRLVPQLKLDQNPDTKRSLLATGNKHLVRNSMRSSKGAKRFWGMEFDEATSRWQGENVVGELWMELRKNLESKAQVTRSDEDAPQEWEAGEGMIPHDHDNVMYFTAVKEPYGWLGNMYGTPIYYEGKQCRTPEALFQWLRFDGFPHVQDDIFRQKGPMGSKMKARLNRDLLNRGELWDDHDSDYDLMRRCLRLKVDQHRNIREMFLATGDKILIENCSNRDRESARFWGSVYNPDSNLWEGNNVLGTLWMEIREEMITAEKQ